MDGHTKLKLLYILEMLRKTDEQHPVNTNAISEYLEKKGVKSERKSVARDIAVLRDAGYSIILCDEYKKGYYMTDQLFEDYELKMIADAISGAKFLTYKDSCILTEKLCDLATASGEKIIKDETFIDSEIKTENCSVKYNIDKIIKAIELGKRIRFQYYEYAADGKLRLKRNAHVYEISPYFLCWTDSGYYMIGNSKSHDHLTHFHVDMMTNMEITDIPIRDRAEIEELKGKFSIGDYLRTNVNMYTGDIISAEFICSRDIASEFRARFGKSAKTKKIDDSHFYAKINVTDGEGLIRWIMQYSATDIKVIAPESLINSIKERASAIANQY